MNLKERIEAFIKLGEEISNVLNHQAITSGGKKLDALIPEIHHRNGWFTEQNVIHRLQILSEGLSSQRMTSWIEGYSINENNKHKTVGVILAGNIPMVGFDDFRCVLISGNKFIGKLASDDILLMPLLNEILIEIEPRFSEFVEFTEGPLRGIDAIIATGSNNSAEYFKHFFSKYPNIIRGNRNGVAVLTGKESGEELSRLGEDIFRYFGLGCRNVTKLFVPENYNFNLFFESIYPWGSTILQNNKYMNNYDYHKTLYLLSSIPLLDNNFLLIKEDAGISSPPGVLFYEYYYSKEDLNTKLSNLEDKIQCLIGNSRDIKNSIQIGNSQKTGPLDYADGVDVLKFLIELS